jgi:preprotein translocase subunit YajC
MAWWMKLYKIKIDDVVNCAGLIFKIIKVDKNFVVMQRGNKTTKIETKKFHKIYHFANNEWRV